jgi:crotonobetainyl-CoA:carnitine CoA-transferase CaiB-like acyl-CoA transferase
MGREDLIEDPRTVDGTARGKHADFIRPIVEGWLADLTRAQAVKQLEEQGVPSGPVYTAEDVFADDHFTDRKMLVTIDDAIAGPRTFARSPLHLSSAPEILTEPAPRLGQHTRSILSDLLEYSDAEIDRLHEQGVIGIPTD